ncbi:hypothetical protein [Flavobacterium sp. TSSA_36]|uniref:hypothetical protein n=1 Tax=Flavobacterium sp. TSSA_36 TaxID=3447669 RepID=UPI003F3290B4
MKRFLLVFWFLFVFNGNAQTTTFLRGKVVSDTVVVKGVEVINLNTEQSTKTDEHGFFEIGAKNNDVVVLYSKDYVFKKMVITPASFKTDRLVVKLTGSAIELDEVVVKNNTIKVPKLNYEQAAALRMAKQAAILKNPAVYDGTITNGMDFIEIGRKIISLFKNSENQKRKKQAKEDFKTYALNNLDADFFQEKFKLQKQETANFLEFCAEDPESKKVFLNKNELTLLDFLFTKHKEYMERRTSPN